MKVTKCDSTHLARTIELYKRVLEYLKNNINYPKWSEKHPSEKNIITAVNKGELFICLDDDNIAGACVISEDPEGFYEAGDWSKSLQEGEFLTIHLLAVDQDYYRKGIGSIMVDACISYAKERGYKAIRLDVVPDNHPASGLYMKKGFTYAGTKDLKRGIVEIPVFDLYELNL